MIKLFKFDQVPLPVYKEVKGKDYIYYGEKNDYPNYLLRIYNNSAKNNAKKGRELNEKNGNKCATQVGKVRSAQLEAGEPISVETLKRMYSYLSRAEAYYDESDMNACGTISFLLWGGLAGAGTQNAAVAFGGFNYNPPIQCNLSCTEEYDGTSFFPLSFFNSAFLILKVDCRSSILCLLRLS